MIFNALNRYNVEPVFGTVLKRNLRLLLYPFVVNKSVIYKMIHNPTEYNSVYKS